MRIQLFDLILALLLSIAFGAVFMAISIILDYSTGCFK